MDKSASEQDPPHLLAVLAVIAFGVDDVGRLYAERVVAVGALLGDGFQVEQE